MIYILLLENKKYYVGYCETTDDRRIQQHFKGNGAQWTKLHPPVKILHIIEQGGLDAENNITINLMALLERERLSGKPGFEEAGYNDVRGGKWTRTQDYRERPKELVAKLLGDVPARNAICKRCERKGHVEINCVWEADKDGDIIMDS